MHARNTVSAVVALVFALFASEGLSAQQALGGSAHPGADRVSFSLYGGGHFAASSLAADTDFDDAGTIGGTVTFWFHENVGMRANTLWAPTDITALQADDVLAGEDPNVWHYSGDVLLRLPLPAGDQMTWFPYAVAGIGGKTYDFETLGTETDFAGNFGAGVELRFGDLGRWGIHTEVRDFISTFDRLGFDETLHDVVWTGGISLNF